jgi:hypothetical protein
MLNDMNENDNWIGKKLSDKDNPNIQHTVIGQEDGTLLLDKNGRIEESRVSSVFNVNSVSESVDPDSFFNGSYGALVGAINNPNKSTSVVGVQEQMGSDTVQMVMGNQEALNAYRSGDYAANQPKRPTPQVNNHGLVPEEEVQHFYGDSMKDVVDEDEFNRVNSYAAPRKPAKKASVFDTMQLKKTTSVKIKLVLEEKIPKIEAIRSMNDLFEQSIIDYLAEEITLRFLQNPILLQEIIAETRENTVYPNKKKKKPVAKGKAKPAAKKTTAAKKPVKNSQTKTKTATND